MISLRISLFAENVENVEAKGKDSLFSSSRGKTLRFKEEEMHPFENEIRRRVMFEIDTYITQTSA